MESLIFMELAWSFLAPSLLFHGFIVFIPQIGESTQQISRRLLDIDMQSERGNFNVFLPPSPLRSTSDGLWPPGRLD